MSETFRPLTIGELIGSALFHYRRHFMTFVGIAALSGILFSVCEFALSSQLRKGDALTRVVFWLGTLIVSEVTIILGQAATAFAVSQVLLGRKTGVTNAFASIRSGGTTIVIVGMNAWLRVILGFLLLIVPGVLLALRYSLAIPVAVVERTGVSDSLARSVTLTEGDRGRIFMVFVFIALVTIVGSMMWPVVVMLANGHSLFAPMGPHPAKTQIVLQVGSLLSQSVLAPVTYITLALLYFDERVRKEAHELSRKPLTSGLE